MDKYKKLLTYLLITSFSFTASIRPVSYTISLGTISYAEGPEDLPTSSQGSFENEDDTSGLDDNRPGEDEDEPLDLPPSSGPPTGGGGGGSDTDAPPPENEQTTGTSSDNNDPTVVSSDQANELIEYCISETDKSEEECENDVRNQSISSDEVLAIQQENKELAESFGITHTSVTLIISAFVQIISIISHFFTGGYKIVSAYLGLLVAIIIFFGFWGNLISYNNLATELAEAEYTVEEGQEINQVEFYADQIRILEEAKVPVENIIKTMEASINITYAAIVVATIEAIYCFFFPLQCIVRLEKKNNKFDQFLPTIFPEKLHANPQAELESQNQVAQARTTVAKTNVDLDNWRKIIISIAKVALMAAFKKGFVNILTDLTLKIFKKSSETAIKKGFARAIPVLRAVFYYVDKLGYEENKKIYDAALEEINKRIEDLKEFSLQVDKSISNGSSIKIAGASSTSAPQMGSFSVQTADSEFLAAGRCHNFNYKNPDFKKVDCSKAKFSAPSPRKLDTSGIKGLEGAADLLDPEETYKNLEKAITTKEGVRLSEFSKNAKKVKGLMPKLLKLMKKKKIKFSTDQKKKDVKPLYLQVLDEAKKRQATVASLSNQFMKEAIKKGNLTPIKKKLSSNLVSKRSATSNQLTIPKIKPIDLSMEEDEQGVAKDTPVKPNYGVLDKFESSAEDIVKKKGVSLWKVISVRYQKSAYDDLLELKKK